MSAQRHSSVTARRSSSGVVLNAKKSIPSDRSDDEKDVFQINHVFAGNIAVVNGVPSDDNTFRRGASLALLHESTSVINKETESIFNVFLILFYLN